MFWKLLSYRLVLTPTISSSIVAIDMAMVGFSLHFITLDVKEYSLDSEYEVMACEIFLFDNSKLDCKLDCKLIVRSFYKPPTSNID